MRLEESSSDSIALLEFRYIFLDFFT